MTFLDKLQLLYKFFPDVWDYFNISRNQSLVQYFRDPSSFIYTTFYSTQKNFLIALGISEFCNVQLTISKARAAQSISAFFL